MPHLPILRAARPRSGCGGCEDVRTRLLNAALEVIYSEGLQAMTQTRVAAVAQVRQSHLTYYFPTRSQLLTAVIEHAVESGLRTFGPQPQAMPASIDDYFAELALLIGQTRIPRLMTALTLACEEEPSLSGWMASFKARVLEGLATSLAHYGLRLSADEVALFHAQMVGLSIMNVSQATPQSQARTQDLFLLAAQRLVSDAAAQAATPPTTTPAPGLPASAHLQP